MLQPAGGLTHPPAPATLTQNRPPILFLFVLLSLCSITSTSPPLFLRRGGPLCTFQNQYVACGESESCCKPGAGPL